MPRAPIATAFSLLRISLYRNYALGSQVVTGAVPPGGITPNCGKTPKPA
jgi:hypothetical protein